MGRAGRGVLAGENPQDDSVVPGSRARANGRAGQRVDDDERRQKVRGPSSEQAMAAGTHDTSAVPLLQTIDV